jgi:hypothetical protein
MFKQGVLSSTQDPRADKTVRCVSVSSHQWTKLFMLTALCSVSLLPAQNLIADELMITIPKPAIEAVDLEHESRKTNFFKI